MPSLSISQDLEYLIIFSTVLILPKMLLKLRIPSGITALIIGIIFGYFDQKISSDILIKFLSQIGITSLFVFAGLEVEFDELKEDKDYLLKYILKSTIALLLVSFCLLKFFELSFQNALILSLGILTPSAGFIINSLHSYKMEKDQEYWIKSKAISKELLAIIFLFVALQFNNPLQLAISLFFFIALFFIMPICFQFFFKHISPYAPNTEVPLLVVLAFASGVISKELGAYYLVGAFIVGLVASRFKKEIFKESEEVIFTSLNSFFNVFLPFYFFYAGTKIMVSSLTMNSLTMGFTLLIIFVPLRILMNTLSIKFLLNDFLKSSYKVSFSLLPTLIFGLVIAGILQERGEVSDKIIFSLIIYTLLSSMLPALLFPLSKRVKEGAKG